jgi:hypothetical protein
MFSVPKAGAKILGSYVYCLKIAAQDMKGLQRNPLKRRASGFFSETAIE